MKRILIVDDEIQILKSLSRIFFETDYEILTAESGEAALRLLENSEVNLVISDMRMPLMDGYELLSRIKESYPNIIRIILSGYTEETSVFKAVLHNIAKYYILKPWSNEDLLLHVRQIFETEDLLKSKDLLLLINNIETFPTIETSYQKILEMIDRDEEIRSISAEIEKDFAISSKLLQIANSAFYGIQTGSVKHATVYLGLQNLKSLIYSTAIINSFDSASIRNHSSVASLWQHALLTNKLLHYIYEVYLGKKLPEAASSSGLLHNIGSLILILNYPGKYIPIITSTEEESPGLTKMEQDAFQVTHQEIGGYLVTWWGLPFPIVESALFHHRPLDPCVMNKEIVACVHLAQHYAYQLMKSPVAADFCPEVFDFLGIPSEAFDKSIQESSFV